MQEFRRIFGRGRFWAVFLILMIINGFYIVNSLLPDRETREDYEENYEGDYAEDLQKTYRTYLEKYQDVPMDTALAEITARIDAHTQIRIDAIMEGTYAEDAHISREDMEIEALCILRDQMKYIAGYPEYLLSIRKSAEEMKEVGILGKEGEFSRRNIDKTVEDFEKVKGVSLTLDNDQGIIAFYKYSFSDYLLLILMIVVVMFLLEERRRGLWQFVYSLPGGRGRLAFVRVLTIFAAALMAGVMLEGENFLITGWYYGGYGDLSRAVQSCAEFRECVLTISMGTYLFLTVLEKILVSAFFGICLWLAVSLGKSPVFAFLMAAIFAAAEYYAFAAIRGQSSWNFWKYVNFFSFLDSGQILGAYQNVNIFGYPAGVQNILLYVMPVFFVLACIYMTAAGRKRPFLLREGFFGHLWGKLAIWRKIYQHGNLILHECYKVILKQRAGIVILLLFLLLYWKKEDTGPIFYDYKTSLYNSYMEQLQGGVTQEKLSYLIQEETIWQDKREVSEEKIEKYERWLENGAKEGESGERVFSSYSEYQQEQMRLEQIETAQAVTQELVSLGEKLYSLVEKGEQTGFVNKIGYDMYLGKRGNQRAETEALIILAVLVAALGGIQSYEKSQNAVYFLRSVKKGRGSLYRAKCFVCICISALVTGAVTADGFRQIDETYGISGFSYSVHSLEMYEKFPLDISIGALLVLLWALRLLMAIAVSMIILYLSGKVGNMTVALLLEALALLMPAALVYMGFQPISAISVLNPMTVSFYWNKYGVENGLWLIPAGIVFGIGVMAGMRGKKLWRE